MTVSELISKLEVFPPDAVVLINCDWDGMRSITTVKAETSQWPSLPKSWVDLSGECF
jgi:hypothetical protein